MTDKIQINAYYAKLRKLHLKNIVLIALEILGIAICTLYVFMGECDITNRFNLLENISNQAIGLFVFMLSIIMALTNSSKVRDDKEKIKSYLESIENGDPKEIIEKKRENVDNLISELDINKQKKKQGYKISLHDERDIIRSHILSIGIVFIASTAVIILFLLDLNFPILVAWGTLMAYGFIMLEFFVYQIILNKNNSNVFSDKHRSIISCKKIKGFEDMKYLQKILYMQSDRLKSYLLSLRFSGIVMNILSISITIIASGDNEKIKKWFGFNDSANVVSKLLSVLAIILYFINLNFGSSINKKINEIESYVKLSYNRKNYNNLKVKYPDLLKYKGVFNRHALDVARGTYEYNIEKICDAKEQNINYQYLFTVKQRIINNIPRVKLTSLITFLFSASILVWYQKNIYNLVYVFGLTLFSFLVAFCGMLFYDYNKYKDWDMFCKGMQDAKLKDL